MDAIKDPIALCHLERQGKYLLWVVEHCPHCGQRHTHGAGRVGEDPAPYLGHRGAHCLASPAGGYYLKEATP
jgi:hypothetical protein